MVSATVSTLPTVHSSRAASDFLNPEIQEEARTALNRNSFLATLNLIQGVVFTALGIVISATVAITPVSVAASSIFAGYGLYQIYLSFNGLVVTRNLRTILNNPMDYMERRENRIVIDREKFRTQLLQNTIAFSWHVDNVLQQHIAMFSRS